MHKNLHQALYGTIALIIILASAILYEPVEAEQHLTGDGFFDFLR